MALVMSFRDSPRMTLSIAHNLGVFLHKNASHFLLLSFHVQWLSTAFAKTTVSM